MKRAGPNDQIVTAHAILLGDRINTSGIEGETLSTSPLTIRIDNEGIAVLFRYGVVVLIGLSQQQEQELLDQVPAGGPILVRAMSPERLLVISDVLAKSVVLAHDERRVAEVFEVIEPFARELATRGKARLNRTGILRLIGNALLVQHRVSGRVAITEKPDALWDRPDLERLYARLEDEYELQERVDTLNRKLAVISETATTLADIIDTQRSLRLELIIVALIALEIVITFYQILASRAGH
jgi:uncharacterized Rmd1/YagE family protein